MPLNGSGSYTPPAPEYPAIPDTIILASDFNTILADIASAISQAIFRDGQAAFTAAQSMGGQKLTALANGTVGTDAINLGQLLADARTFAAKQTFANGIEVTVGNIKLSTAGGLFEADFTHATLTSRAAFKTTTVDGETKVAANPNGTAVASGWQAYNAADPTNAGYAELGISATEVNLTAGKTGAGGYLPLAVYIGGVKRLEITSDGAWKLAGNAGAAGEVLKSQGSAIPPIWGTPFGYGELPVVEVTDVAVQMEDNKHYVLLNVAATTATLPAAPELGSKIYVTVGNGLTTNVIARNGKNIMDLAQDMTLDRSTITAPLRYIDAVTQWRVI